MENKIDANALSEDDAEKVNELLDQADALCTEGNFKDASAALARSTAWSARNRLRSGRTARAHAVRLLHFA